MRLLNFILILTTTFTAFSQLTGTMTISIPAVCQGASQPIISMVGSGGTSPYTFYYTINGGPTQQVSSSTGEDIAEILVPTTTPGIYTYQLITIEDATLASANPNFTLTSTVNPLPAVNAGPDQLVCAGSMVVLNGIGAMTYSWSNGVVNGVPFMPVPGTMPFTVWGTDANGCSNSDQMILTVLNGPTLSSNNITIDSAYCNNGSIQVIPTGGTPPYMYNWNTGVTTAVVTDLSPGIYTVTITDINGCATTANVTITQSAIPQACASVSGTVTVDNDMNCQISAGDNPLANRIIRATPGNSMTMTDANGNYTLNLIPGDYVIEEMVNTSGYFPSCQSSYNINLPDVSTALTGYDFYDTITGTSDLVIYVGTSQIRPLFLANIYLTIAQYNGEPLGTRDIWFTLPAGVTLNSFPLAYTQSNDTVYTTITSSQSGEFVMGYIFGSNLTIGSTITFNAGIEQDAGEYITLNNTSSYTTTVVASYDPNDKRMFLNGVESDFTILLTDQVLEYMVRFQNTGTASAIDIHILDTIAETLDITSFEFIGSSHPCTVSIQEDRTMKFDFPGINLPDSTSNEPQSHGFVRYRIRQSQGNQVGTIINNTAYIYFDLNEAVITNTTYDEIVEPSSGINEMDFSEVHLYPNPTRDDLNIQSDNRLLHAVVTDLSGKVIHETALTGHIAQLGVQSLPAGHYLVRIEMEGRVAYRRFVKQ